MTKRVLPMPKAIQQKRSVLLEKLRLLRQSGAKGTFHEALFQQVENDIQDVLHEAEQAIENLNHEKAVAYDLKDSLNQLLVIQHLSEMISRTKNIEDILSGLCTIAHRVVPFAGAAVYLLDRKTKNYELQHSEHLSKEQLAIIQVHIDEGVINWVMSEKRAVAVPNLHDLKQDPIQDTRGFIVVPLLASEKKIGFLELWEDKLQEIRASTHFDMLEFLSRQAAIAVENTQLYEQLNAANELFKKSQLQIIQAEKMAAMGVMASGVAHEINNPLQIILARVQLMMRKLAEGEMRTNMKLVERETLRISGIVTSMLRYTKQQRQLSMQFVSIESIVKDVLVLIQQKLSLQNIEVVTEFEKSIPQLNLNAGEIEQVFLNLFENSAHAMKTGGKLTVRIHMKQFDVLVEVEDTGTGIEKEHLSQIFVPFFTTKSPNEGTGLGLFLCYGIIERHGARIHVESTVGSGTKFVLRFPTHEHISENI